MSPDDQRRFYFKKPSWLDLIFLLVGVGLIVWVVSS